MHKRLVTLVLVAGLVALMPGASEAKKWDIDDNVTVPITDVIRGVIINPCATPPQVIEDFEGGHHFVQKLRFLYDEDGNVENFEGHVHCNHQGVTAVGYDLEVDEDGNIVWDGDVPVKAVDEDGNFITVEYNIPGTFNYGQQFNEKNDDGKWNMHETFMCNLISKGKTGNGLIHFNGHWQISEDGKFDLYTDNYWCKCTGAGPSKNGPIDCDEFEDFCQEPVLPGGPY